MKDSSSPLASLDSEQRRADLRTNKNIYDSYSFCFPILDLELTPKKIELLTETITASRGTVIKYTGKAMHSAVVDFLLVNPKMNIQTLRNKVDAQISYREILDYHFIVDSNRANQLLNYEKYSLYINLDFVGFADQKEAKLNTPSKKIKVDEQEDSDITVKLSED